MNRSTRPRFPWLRGTASATPTQSPSPPSDSASRPEATHAGEPVSPFDEDATVPFREDESGDDLPLPSRRTALGVMGGFAVLAAAGTLLGSDLLHPPASTADGDYAGETIEFLIPLAEGGGTDTWARFIGTQLTHAIPGSPGFAPTNEAGGEGITGTNHFVSSARADGTELLVSTATTVVPWLLKRQAVRYDFAKLMPVLANGTGAVVYARTGAGVTGLKDVMDRSSPLKFGGIAATGLDLTTLLAFDLLGMDVSAVFGFEGRGPVNLALQRGEIDIDYQTTSAYPSAVKTLLEEKAAVALFSLGQLDENRDVVRDPNFKDLPTVVEAYESLHGTAPSGAKLEAYKTVLGVTYTYQKGLWVPPETPPEAVELLRTSARKLGQSAAFEKAANKVLGGYPLDAGADLRQRIEAAYTVSPEVRQHVVQLLTSTYNVKID
jgi:tripartite-type tricarboxylate transporter receptor subunit TctC